jgi:hypothetical protein
MAKVQIPGVGIRDLTPQDLQDPQLAVLNEYLRQIATSLNALVGSNGKVPFSVDIDMQGNSIHNVKNIAGT